MIIEEEEEEEEGDTILLCILASVFLAGQHEIFTTYCHILYVSKLYVSKEDKNDKKADGFGIHNIHAKWGESV